MSCVRTPHRLRRSLVLSGNADCFFPASEWMPATGITAVDLLMRVLSVDWPGQVKPGFQIASARTDKPKPGQAISDGAFVSSEGVFHFRERESFSKAAFVRFGFVGRLQKGHQGPSAVEVEMDVAVRMCGEVLGTKTVEIQPFTFGGDDEAAVVPITDWSPTVGVDKLKAVFVVLDNHNEALQYQLVVRTASDRMEPDPWQSVEDKRWEQPRTGNSERNTGELPIPEDARFEWRSLFQLGLAYRKKSGAPSNPRCTIHTLSHCRYA
jgi:hypothetical protein